MLIEEHVEKIASGPSDWEGAEKAISEGDFAGPEFFEYGEVLDVLIFGDTEAARDDEMMSYTPESKREAAKQTFLDDLDFILTIFTSPAAGGFTDDGPPVIEALDEGFVFRGNAMSEPKAYGTDPQIKLLRLYYAGILEVVGYDLRRQGFRR